MTVESGTAGQAPGKLFQGCDGRIFNKVMNLIREGKAFQIPSVMQTSRKLGMIQLGDVLIDLVDQGLVEPQEAYMKCTDKASFMTMLKNRGHELVLSS